MHLSEEVYRLVRKIPKGRVTTYSEIGKALNTRAYQAIGQILAKNPDGFKDGGKTPCHRVVPKNGTIGGFCGQKCGKKICIKKKLLESEGIKFDKTNRIIDFEEKNFFFNTPR